MSGGGDWILVRKDHLRKGRFGFSGPSGRMAAFASMRPHVYNKYEL